ncbi:putative regulatory protein [Actinoplanes missouriensis 431]|uniref:Putative regulatory protein n=1 Tax=Actinoplanes missouriensis (strain ATCC 14538 / DSM 43046 / CBS 188.64 / JCM 3121 / NBRC 102363 / NCIMB 12654 / NRRL B-3342 / UNCC 431) TaxID=512565 RepID=I0H9X0_ACTM4|nr:putative regulatory protein [Actinoplanes missouriensis 431]
MPLRGRDGELAELTRRIGTVHNGGASIVVVTGAPGSGKTRLLHEAQRVAAARHVRTVRLAGDPDAALAPGEGLLRGLDISPPRQPGAEHRYWFLQEVQDGLERAARRQPLLIAVDDLQWCDDLTLLALRVLPERLAGYPILWLLAGRETESSPGYVNTLARLDAGGATTLILGDLDDDAAARMAADVLGAAPSGELLDLARSAGNSPLLIRELMTGIREEGRADLPTRVRTLVQRRLARLPRDTRAVLEVASVLSRRLLVPCLADLLRRTPAQLLDSVRVALAEDLLRSEGEELVFRHDLVREAIRATVPPPVARALRREAAAAAARSGSGPLEVAALMADSAEPGDQEAIAALRTAAARLAADTPAGAADLSRRALALTRAGTTQHQEVTAETVRLLWLAGRAHEATVLGRTLLHDDLAPEAEAAARIGIAAVCSQYSFAEAVRQCAITAGLPGLSTRTRTSALALMGVNQTMTGDITGAGTTLAEVLRDADEPHRALALAALSVVALYRDDWAGATELADEVVKARAGADLWGPTQWRGYLDALAGRPDLALEHAASGMRVAQRDGQAWQVRQWSMDRCRLLFDAGRLDDARAEAEGVLAMADELGAGNYADCTALVTAARVALHTGDLAAARRYDADAERMRADEAPLVRRAGRWIGALVAVAHDRDPDRIRQLLAEAAGTFGSPGPALGSPMDPADDVTFVRIALSIGEHGWAGRAVAAAEQRSAANPSYPFLAATAGHARGLLDGDRHRILAAIETYRAFPRPLPLAAALEDADGHEEALTVYDRVGATRDAARVRGELRRRGIHRRPAAPGRRGRGPLVPADRHRARRRREDRRRGHQPGGRGRHVPVTAHREHPCPTCFHEAGHNSRVELTRLAVRHLVVLCHDPRRRARFRCGNGVRQVGHAPMR